MTEKALSEFTYFFCHFNKIWSMAKKPAVVCSNTYHLQYLVRIFVPTSHM